ncbi:hypothetical protein IV500_05015 [Paeniglutamicibacter antarcticus]|uniref:Uncharacterized protein n=1 Tax=Arthrobacter terrae TaxID=2935737 RepID=A0A931G704_9MICC|nr:hypothetical protein [Arthrobacter terrae]MBG0738779.1 hypothetical protein [Arthrobacter terrae]
MIKSPATKPAFARALAYGYKAPSGTEIIPPYGREIIFNRDLTGEELRQLTDSYPVPGRTLRLVGGYSFLASCFIPGVTWIEVLLGATIADATDVRWITEQEVPGLLNTLFSFTAIVSGWLGLLAIVVAATGIVTDFVAWKKWGVELSATWARYAGRVVSTKGLPTNRKQAVETFAGRLDSALKKLDPADPVAQRLDAAARQAIGFYIDLPVMSEHMRNETASADDQIRDPDGASPAAEAEARQAAGAAVFAVREYARKARPAAADPESIASSQVTTDKASSSLL